MDQESNVTVIIPNYRRAAYLLDCLASVEKTIGPRPEVIVVDNGSQDESVNLVESMFPWVIVAKLDENRGFAEACNIGAEAASRGLLIFLNNDTVVAPDLIVRLSAALRAPDVGAACPKALAHDDPDRLNSAGGICDRFAFGWNRGIEERDLHQYDAWDSSFYAVGSCLAIRRDIFLRLGGFDAEYFAYLEDLDLSWRLRIAGYRVAYVPDAVIYHKWMSSPSDLSRIQYLYHRNRLRTMLKNYQLRTLAAIMPIYAVLQGLLMIWSLVIRNGVAGLQVLKALGWNLLHLPDTMHRRAAVQTLRKVSDSAVLQAMYPGVAGIYFALGTIRHPLLMRFAVSSRGRRETGGCGRRRDHQATTAAQP